jgi:3-oxoacyl-[acyl-carrier protein] reductase
VNLGLEGKTAFVVGGGGGLGGAVARALASEGARVAVAGRNQQSVGRTVDTITAEAGEALAVYLDLSDLTSFDSALASVRASYGEVEILFNNSGGPPPSTAAGQPIHLWREQFEAMVMGVIALTDLVLPSMRERGWGRIVTSTSSGVVAPIPNLALSNTLRLSLVGWSKALATEVAADGITVNVVVPGRIATDRVGALDEARAKREGSTVEEIVGSAIATIPAGRYGEPDEYAAVVAFLAGERASYVTGTMVRVDGGQIPSI